MKLEYTVLKESHTRLILIFAGWGADQKIAAGISLPGWDVAVVHDFTDMSFDISFLDKYYTVYLFAWSLGVGAAARLLPADRVTAAFAINGTIRPVDSEIGIPEAIFEGTMAGLDVRNLKKFRMRMADSRETYAEMKPLLTPEEECDIENLKTQLQQVETFCADNEPNPLPWVRAFIGKNDRIFPPDNQQKAWHRDNEVEQVILDKPHYIKLQSIINGIIANPEKVSARFSKASGSYDTHAIAQYSAVIKLNNLLREKSPSTGGNTLEIGCGTGLFTHEYARVLRPSESTFVDITKTGPFGIAPEEIYVVQDAEQWILSQQREWDYILSSSAIQWFADIPRFLGECHKHLKPGGILAISTFLPGNLEELDALRPSPFIYPKAEMLRKNMEAYFEEVQVVEDCIRLEFKSVREVLLHLKKTGVGGSAPATGLTMKDMSHLRTLTFRPVYILGRKPRDKQ